MLGEFGGLIGRGMKAWSGVGLLKKEEKDLLKIEEGIGEGSDVGFLSGMEASLRDARNSLRLSLTALSSLGIEGC